MIIVHFKKYNIYIDDTLHGLGLGWGGDNLIPWRLIMTTGSIEDCTVEWIDVFDLRLFNGWKSELKIVLSKRLPEKKETHGRQSANLGQV